MQGLGDSGFLYLGGAGLDCLNLGLGGQGFRRLDSCMRYAIDECPLRLTMPEGFSSLRSTGSDPHRMADSLNLEPRRVLDQKRSDQIDCGKILASKQPRRNREGRQKFISSRCQVLLEVLLRNPRA